MLKLGHLPQEVVHLNWLVNVHKSGCGGKLPDKQTYRKSFCEWPSCTFGTDHSRIGDWFLLPFKILRPPYVGRDLSYW